MGLRIVFMGTPEFAVPSLEVLHRSQHQVVAVVTSADKYGGRGRQRLLQSAVKRYALQHELPILQPRNLKHPDFTEQLASFHADLQVVVAFRMLPEVVWNMPPLGTMNLHGSLLPRYRGAAPINWAIINGESVTGVTTFMLKHEIDTGDMLMQREIPILPDDTAGTLHDRMKEIGAQVVVESVDRIACGDLTTIAQDPALVSKAPKIHHETCEIDFAQPTQRVYNFIRGLSPYPTAWTRIDGKQFNIYRCHPVTTEQQLEPGTILTNTKDILDLITQDGAIRVDQLQLEGRKRMATPDFLNGYQITSKTVG
ncbi:MAG: methionyl-tRNA formyltransferase [Saprospiraceae bacterium]|nr:methionyl-tRNA formyltransferase [Saprospiraceae bacterium]